MSRIRYFFGCKTGQISFHTREPPEPNDVIWENLNITLCERIKTSVIIAILGLITLVACFTFAYNINAWKQHNIDEAI